MLCYNELVLNEFHKYTLFFLRWFLIFMTDFGVFLFSSVLWFWFQPQVFVLPGLLLLFYVRHSAQQRTLLSKSPLWLFRFSWNILAFSIFLFNYYLELILDLCSCSYLFVSTRLLLVDSGRKLEDCKIQEIRSFRLEFVRNHSRCWWNFLRIPWNSMAFFS